MKIAIQGHLTRGKEVIQILESLGGKNTEKLEGTYKTFYYIDNKGEIGDDHRDNFPPIYKLYTLDEFESEFPFKIGDKVIIPDYNNKKGTIVDIAPCGPILSYFIKLETGNGIYRPTKSVKPYKEMKEERNITLTLDKAKEWYKKGGELREIALQAFTETELNPLPRSWEEYISKIPLLKVSPDRMPISSLPKKYIALYKLEKLRDCWIQGWEPNWLEGNVQKYVIQKWRDKCSIETTYVTHSFLSFPTYEMANEFLECFKDLIEQAGDLI